MFARSRCRGCAARISPIRLIEPQNGTTSLSQARLFHPRLPQRGGPKKERRKLEFTIYDKSHLVPTDTIDLMVRRANVWLYAVDEFQTSIKLATSRYQRQRHEPLVDHLQNYVDEADQHNDDIVESIIEILEYKVNHVVKKLRPVPRNNHIDLWLREKSMQNWRLKVCKRKGGRPSYIRNSFGSTKHNSRILKKHEKHHMMALLLESERLKLDRTLLRTIKLYSFVRQETSLYEAYLIKSKAYSKRIFRPPPGASRIGIPPYERKPLGTYHIPLR